MVTLVFNNTTQYYIYLLQDYYVYMQIDIFKSHT